MFKFKHGRTIFTMMMLFMVAMMTVSVSNAQEPAATGDESRAPDACTAYAHPPYNSGNKVRGSGYARCDNGYHTFEVCIKKDVSGVDPWSCVSGNGTWSTKLLNTGDFCFLGAGSYYTEVTLDGAKSQSGRVQLSCS